MAKHKYIPNPIKPELPGIYCPVIGQPSYDGDTISVVTRLGPLKIRLSGINTPELNEPGGDTAKMYVNGRLRCGVELWAWLELAKDRDGDGQISLWEILKTASFDRWPGTVYLDGEDLRVDLLAKELATEG